MNPTKFLDPFDRYMVGVIIVILLAIGGVVIYGDHVGVKITEVNPENNTISPTNVSIQITFDQAMNRSSVESNFSIEPEVEGTFRWRNLTMIFLPNTPLKAGQQYTYILRKGTKSITGRTFDKTQSWSFTTQAPVATVPTAYYLSPATVIERSLWAVSVDSLNPRLIYSTPYGIWDFAPSPDGLQIALTVYGQEQNTSDVWIINADGTNPQQLTDCFPGACGRPAWSPDGQLIAYEYQIRAENGGLAPSRVWLWELATDATAPVFEDSQVLGYLATWGPQGRVISFYDSSVTAIRVVDLATQDTKLIETDLSEQWSFSPDGQILVYTDLRKEDRWYFAEVLTVNLTSAEKAPVFENPEEDQEAAWSPDGQWLAFRRRLIEGGPNSGWQLMLYNPTTKELRQLTNDSTYTNRNIQWHPNGELILFQRYNLNPEYGQAEIWVYDLITDQLVMLAIDAFSPRWS